MMRTANPALNDKTFDDFEQFGSAVPAAMGSSTRRRSRRGSPPPGPVVLDAPGEYQDPGEYADPGEVMTLHSTVAKTAILLAILGAAAWYTWSLAMEALVGLPEAAGLADGFAAMRLWVLGGMIGGFVVAMVTVFKKTWSPVTAPLYAALEGLFLGGVSAMFEVAYPGIAFQAVALTFGTLFALLFAYRSGLIKATENFKLGVAAATGGIFLVYIVGWVMSFFGSGIPYIHESGTIGIAFSAFVVVIAALNLVLDFDFIEEGAARGAPKYMEWYGAFGLLVTLVWLYIEILILLSKLRGRN